MIRWQFSDSTVPETWTVPFNPNVMSSPFRKTTKESMPGAINDGRPRALSTDTPVEWTFGGVMRTQFHYDEMLRWVQKPNEVQITDHLSRTFVVLLTQLEITDVHAKNLTKWTYVTHGFVVGYL